MTAEMVNVAFMNVDTTHSPYYYLRAVFADSKFPCAPLKHSEQMQAFLTPIYVCVHLHFPFHKSFMHVRFLIVPHWFCELDLAGYTYVLYSYILGIFDS
uniref:Ovule protein n=1 Tax=Ascaris lumbricoides TaxID=6252 RepID=A0A0M3IBF9_ASCLU